MTFPSSSGTTVSLGKAWNEAINAASMIKQRAQAVRSASASGPIGSSMILDMLVLFADQKLILNASSAVSGIAAFAQEQTGNANIAADFSAMNTQLDATRDWVINNFPKDANGYLLAVTLAVDGRWVDRSFTTAALATLRTVLDALISTID